MKMERSLLSTILSPEKDAVFLTMFLVSLVFGATTGTERGNCTRFSRKLQKCMYPFLDIHHPHQKPLDHNRYIQESDLLQHLCFEYTKTLQCLHSLLSSCSTPKNVRRVQHKLGAEWVKDINQLCQIHSNNQEDSSDKNQILKDFSSSPKINFHKGNKDTNKRNTDFKKHHVPAEETTFRDDVTNSEATARQSGVLNSLLRRKLRSRYVPAKVETLSKNVVQVRTVSLSAGYASAQGVKKYTIYNIFATYDSSAATQIFVSRTWCVMYLVTFLLLFIAIEKLNQ